MNDGIVGVVDGQKVIRVLGKLKDAGISEWRVSVLIPCAPGPPKEDIKRGTTRALGTLIGVIATKFGVVSTFVMVGVGSVLVAGPLMCALGEVAAGGVVNGLADSVAQIIGMPGSRINAFEAELKDGRGLIVVECGTGELKARARRALLDARVLPMEDTWPACQVGAA